MNEKQLDNFINNNIEFFYIDNWKEIILNKWEHKDGFITHFRFKNIKNKDDVKNTKDFIKWCINY